MSERLPHITVINNLPELMAVMPRLTEAAQSWGQGDAVVDLPHFFSEPHRLRHLRWLLLVSPEPGGPLSGAVMLEEYGTRWLGLGLFSTFNRRWRRTVFGPPGKRAGVAAAAARFLVDRGARFINIDIDMGQPILDEPNPLLTSSVAQVTKALGGIGVEWSLTLGRKHFDLPLGNDFDSSLLAMGPNTRRNLRRYRRAAVEELGCTYHPALKLTLAEFLATNAQSHYRVSSQMARWRHESLQRFPGTFLIGLRHRDGRWLSIGGGRRAADAVEMDWQMNLRGFERSSLSTVLRSFLIEDEARRGTRSLSAEGGVQSAMQDGFRPRAVYNLAVRVDSWPLRMVERGAVRFFPLSTFAKLVHKPWREWRRS